MQWLGVRLFGFEYLYCYLFVQFICFLDLFSFICVLVFLLFIYGEFWLLLFYNSYFILLIELVFFSISVRYWYGFYCSCFSRSFSIIGKVN